MKMEIAICALMLLASVGMASKLPTMEITCEGCCGGGGGWHWQAERQAEQWPEQDVKPAPAVAQSYGPGPKTTYIAGLTRMNGHFCWVKGTRPMGGSSYAECG